MTEPLNIDVISDVVCPWCFIGKRRLEAALKLYEAKYPDRPAPVVTWHPYQLNPDLPREGIPRKDYIAQKFGGRPYPNERLESIGTPLGIAFAFDKIVRQPNTLAAHSLIQRAGQTGGQAQMKEALLQAYFLNGADLTDEATLVRIAQSSGMDKDEAAACLDSEEARDMVSAEEDSARRIGVEGVPFFIFNRKLGVSGAQEADTLLGAMEESEKEDAQA
jgi:predicted DsbA family dithiol-disulfide isomerase